MTPQPIPEPEAVGAHECHFNGDLRCIRCQRPWMRALDLDGLPRVRPARKPIQQRRPLSQFEVRKIRRLFLEGSNQTEIAAKIPCTARTVQKVLERKGRFARERALP